MNATVKTTGKFAPGLTFTKPDANAIHESQRNARPQHGKTIRHLAAWADEVERRNGRLVAALQEYVKAAHGGSWSIAIENAKAVLKELGEADAVDGKGNLRRSYTVEA